MRGVGLVEQPVALARVDLGLPDGNGIDLIAETHAADPSLAILVISALERKVPDYNFTR